VCFSIAEDKSEVVGADGFRLFVKELSIKLPPATILIPADTVYILEGLWRKAPKDIHPDLDAGVIGVALSKRMMGFRFNSGQMIMTWGGITILSQLTQGTFPAYQQLIPNPPNRIKLFGPDLYQALRQVSKVALEGSGIVRLVWAEKQMQVSSKGENTSASTSFPILEGTEDRIALNLSYLLQYFKDKAGIVEMATSTPSSPVLLLDGKSTVVLMPMFVEWEGDPPKSEAVTQAESVVAEVENKAETAPEEDHGDEVPPPEQVPGLGQGPGLGQVEAGMVAEAEQAEAKTIAEDEQPKPKRKRKVKAKA
jgi:DNA polymerase III sliding clamp (beta) subunit (PCNA family)